MVIYEFRWLSLIRSDLNIVLKIRRFVITYLTNDYRPVPQHLQGLFKTKKRNSYEQPDPLDWLYFQYLDFHSAQNNTDSNRVFVAALNYYIVIKIAQVDRALIIILTRSSFQFSVFNSFTRMAVCHINTVYLFT